MMTETCGRRSSCLPVAARTTTAFGRLLAAPRGFSRSRPASASLTRAVAGGGGGAARRPEAPPLAARLRRVSGRRAARAAFPAAAANGHDHGITTTTTPRAAPPRWPVWPTLRGLPDSGFRHDQRACSPFVCGLKWCAGDRAPASLRGCPRTRRPTENPGRRQAGRSAALRNARPALRRFRRGDPPEGGCTPRRPRPAGSEDAGGPQPTEVVQTGQAV
jgi:hypothetical protein